MTTTRLPLPIVAAASLFAGGTALGAGPDPEPVTFTRDVAPIIFAHCASCHRPGESAPFSLLDYESVKKRDRQIAAVTASGFMPPWLPEAGHATLAGDRRLTPAQVDVVRRWVEAGSVAGDPSDLPPVPAGTDGWQLGEPDLVVTFDRSYLVPAEGTDVFRNFVVPVPVVERRWVRAVELRPGNPRVVHHAVINIDRTRASRREDLKDAEPGFPGMSMGRSTLPDGHFIGWTPGRMPDGGADDMAWRLDRGTDLVIQLHMVPTGKPEEIRPSVGLYFNDAPPTRHPVAILLRNDAIDIAPGETDHAIEDSFVLPVPVEVTGVYPHAHYLGKTIEAFALRPDGTRQILLRIPEWDFNWQDEYRFAEPITLPAGTTVGMRFTYDNSAENVRNPNQPPQRVEFGERSVDEMGTLTIVTIPGSDEDHAALARSYRTRSQERFIAYAEWRLERDPRDDQILERLGSAYLVAGDEAKAIECLEKAIEINRKNVDAHITLGGVLGLQGRFHAAIGHFQEALEEEPDHADTNNNMGVAYLNIGEAGKAIPCFQRALRIDPGLVEAYVNLGTALMSEGRTAEAVQQFQRAKARLTDPRIHYNLGNAYLTLRRPDEAIEEYRAALRLEPRYTAARFNMSSAQTMRGDLDAALATLAEVLEVESDNSMARGRYGLLLLRRGRAAEAVEQLRRVVGENPEIAEAQFGLGGALATVGDLEAARPHFIEAARLDAEKPLYLNSAAWLLCTSGPRTPENLRDGLRMAERAAELTAYRSPSILDTLAAAYAANGRFDRAVRTLQAALGIARTDGDESLISKLQERLALYRRGEAFIEG